MNKKKIIVLLVIIVFLALIISLIMGKYSQKNKDNKNIIIEETSCIVKKNEENKYGIVNNKGELIVPFIYNEGFDYNNGIAVLTNEKGSTYFNSNGEIVGSENLALNGPVNIYTKEDYLAIKDAFSGLYGFIDQEGKLQIPFKWKDVYNFCNGLALVEDDSGVYVIDLSGNIIINPETLDKYESVKPLFIYNLLIVSKGDDNYGVINTKGKEIVGCEQGINHIEVTNDNIIVYKNSKTIYYDLEGNKL